MTKEKKRRIVLVLILIVAAGLAGITGYRYMTNVVSVYPVTMLKSDWENTDKGNVGVVGNAMTQTVVPGDDMEIEKIYVEEGQTVKIGDKLLSYNVEEKKLDLELKEYDVKELEISIEKAEKNLENLKKGIVTESYSRYGGSVEKRVSFLTSLFMRTLDYDNDETDVNDGTGDDTDTTDYEDTTDTDDTYDDSDTDSDYDDDDYYEPEYSWQEIQDMIKAQESELSELRLDLKEQKLEYDTLKKEVDDATVLAVMDGFVKEINAAAADGNAAVTIVSEKNLSIKGTIDEFYYQRVKIGMTVTAVSWETGKTCKAKITELSSFPVSSSSENSDNPNVSYYPFTAVIDESYQEVEAGETVTMRFDENSVTEGAGSIYLPVAYVRTENNTSYVYIRNEKGRLKKQPVEIGQSYYNMVVEVKSGIGYDDYVAFPYGKTVKEGARTEISENDSEIIY